MAKRKTTDDTGPTLETGMLAFARSIQPSEGLFWGVPKGDAGLAGGGQDSALVPVEVIEKGVRGQSSEYKTDNPGKSNPQVVEAASVPLGCDRLQLRYTMWVAPLSLKPWACGEPEVAKANRALAAAYKPKGGYRVLAGRLAWNIANARFAWRNRYLADAMSVGVEFDGLKVVFDPLRLDLDRPASGAELRSAVVSTGPETVDPAETLVDWIAQGLSDEAPRFLSVVWEASMPEGQEVFPSQEYLREEKAKRDSTPSRVYAKLIRHHRGRELKQASMHSQKIGAALRHIDNWHGDPGYGPIAVNPYGGVQETGAVLRKPESGRSFYSIRKRPTDLLAGIDAAADGSCPESWCMSWVALLVSGVSGRAGHAATAGSMMVGSSLSGAMVSSVM